MEIKYLTLPVLISISCLMPNAYAADTATANKIKANQYIKCAANSVTTGAIKTAFNQQSDRESQMLIYGGAAMAMYAGWITTPEYALSSYKEHQQILKQDSQKYIESGSRDEIYNFTVTYLVPKNEKCVPLMKELQANISKPSSDFHNFKNTQAAKQLMDSVIKTSTEMVVGKDTN